MTRVFVFGPNLAGSHGMSYAIPTKDCALRPLALPKIEEGVGGFIAYARKHWSTTFILTKVGCGLASVCRVGNLSFLPAFPVKRNFPLELP